MERTDNVVRQIELGKQIVKNHPQIYSESVIDGIKDTINFLRREESLSELDMFYVSVYDYWTYGFTTEEEFYLNLFNKTDAEKTQYVSHMGRINYMRHLNSVEDQHVLENKNETYNLLKEYYGRDVLFFDKHSKIDDFRSFFDRHEEFVIKPVGMATSIGVRKASRSEYDNDAEVAFNRILQEIEDIRLQYHWAKLKGVIVEEVIKQGDAIAVLHPNSINSVRFTTVRCGDSIHFFYPVLRIGMGGVFLCSGAVGSILTGINVTTGITETFGRNERNECYVVHPNTGIPIKGITIPKWDELCELAKKLALKFDTLRYIGWDFVWTKYEQWVVMEANENGEFLGQIAYQKGLREEFQSIIDWKSPKEPWWKGKYEE